MVEPLIQMGLMTWRNTWFFCSPPSPPCWIAFCTMGTFSNAAPAAGEPRPAVREKANDKPNHNSNGKKKSDKDAGQRTPGGVATRDPRASHAGASP